MTRSRRRLHWWFPGAAVAVLATALVAPPSLRAQQDQAAAVAYQRGRALAIQGSADSAMTAFKLAALLALESGDLELRTAALEGLAETVAVYRGCTDSAAAILRDAVEAAPPGDRLAADALIRHLSARGRPDEARRVLTSAYAGVEGLGRTITHESLHFLQGMAAVQRAAGQEAAALASLRSALDIAARLEAGDVADSVTVRSDAVHAHTFWLLYDLARLRLEARSAGIRQPREGERLMTELARAGVNADLDEHARFVELRLLDRLVIKAHACTLAGSTCPPPKPPKC
jgi:tetratricopeptide (TPR) repeat protein